jgi:hypothetical protein
LDILFTGNRTKFIQLFAVHYDRSLFRTLPLYFRMLPEPPDWFGRLVWSTLRTHCVSGHKGVSDHQAVSVHEAPARDATPRGSRASDLPASVARWASNTFVK